MNEIVALDAALPQRDGYVSLSATGRAGREAVNATLRSTAIAMDEALLRFIDRVGRKALSLEAPQMHDHGIS